MRSGLSFDRSRFRRSWWVIGAVIVLAIALLGVVPPVGATGGHGWSTISGDSAFDEACIADGGAGALRLEGSLDGCLTFYPTWYKCTPMNGFDLYRERGHELFEGADGGSFDTRYTLEATYAEGACDALEAEDFDAFFGMQITGGCDHYIVPGSGQGDLRGARGMFTLHDVVPNPADGSNTGNFATNFLYHGRAKNV